MSAFQICILASRVSHGSIPPLYLPRANADAAGWVSSMSMPSSLIGFAFFKTLSRHLDIPFTPVENVLVQTVAGSMGTMPLGCGFVGVMPALNYMLKPEEGGPLFLDLWKLILWALGLCFFGVVFAVPLRRQVIIREKLKFPSGTATALMISVLHGQDDLASNGCKRQKASATLPQTLDDGNGEQDFTAASLNSHVENATRSATCLDSEAEDIKAKQAWEKVNWFQRVKLLIFSFAVSGLYTLATYFFPILRNLPIFGRVLAESWLWTLNPSLAYVGQGIIMGPATTMHMLFGAIIGWGVLSPIAKRKGWAPGPVDDWEIGSKGWIIWISLAIMLADSIVSLSYISSKPVISYFRRLLDTLYRKQSPQSWKYLISFRSSSSGYSRIDGVRDSTSLTRTASNISERNHPPFNAMTRSQSSALKDLPDIDAPPEHLISGHIVWIGLIISILFCILCIRITFGALVPLYATVTAVFMALILSIMGVRALGETDLNPVSGISKLAQLFFALIIPQANKNSVLINLIAGAVSEAGALQAGDLMQDLKTGHLLGAAPNAQFWGQIIGSAVGAVMSALIYKLYTNVYAVPGDLFQVPTGYVWIFTARLVTGKGLPSMAWQWAIGAAVLFTITTCARILGNGKKWHPYIPGGIAVAVGKNRSLFARRVVEF